MKTMQRSSATYRSAAVAGDGFRAQRASSASYTRASAVTARVPARPAKPAKISSTRNSSKSKKKSKFKSRAKALLYTAAVFAVGFLLVSRGITVYETGISAQRARAEHAAIQTKNEQIKLQIDRAVDLKVLEGVAAGRLGMTRPERYQLFYIDMNTNDFGEKIVRKKDAVPIEEGILYGVPGVLIKAIETLK